MFMTHGSPAPTGGRASREPGSPGVLYVTGPTGAGKSALAVAVAVAVGAEIVNTDAFQLYRGLEILTAAPAEAERARVPHHLYGVLGPGESCDAARYASMARVALAAIAARGRPALVVGGSGLYLKALTHGLSDLPSDAALRAVLEVRSLEDKIAELRALDPVGAAAMNLANPRHVERALEICLLTGRPASEGRSAWSAPDPAGLRGVMLTWEREELYRRIGRRVEAMFDAGVVAEVAALTGVPAAGSGDFGGREAEPGAGGSGGVCASGGGPPFSPTAEKAIGLREIREHLAGRLSRAEAVALIQQGTRRYAKRQGTWFRRERWLKTVCLGADATPDSAAASILREFFS